jgi:hypothetical protein
LNLNPAVAERVDGVTCFFFVSFNCSAAHLSGDRRYACNAIATLPFPTILRRSTAGFRIKILNYDGRGFWLCQRRLSKGRFRWWPESDQASLTLEAHQLQLLLAGGDPAAAKGVAVWRPVQEKV